MSQLLRLWKEQQKQWRACNHISRILMGISLMMISFVMVHSSFGLVPQRCFHQMIGMGFAKRSVGSRWHHRGRTLRWGGVTKNMNHLGEESLISCEGQQAIIGERSLTMRSGLSSCGERQFGAFAEALTDILEQEETVPIKIGLPGSELKHENFVASPFQYHEELTLTVSKLADNGMGVCRTSIKSDRCANAENRLGESNEENNDRGEWVVFVPNVIPGEKVLVRVFYNNKTYTKADLVKVIEPSSERVKPPCKLSTICGGCQYQHINIDMQRQWKRAQVQDCLERIAGFAPASFPPVSATVGTDETYYYRSKISPHYKNPKRIRSINDAAETTSGEDDNRLALQAIGFEGQNSRHLIDVPECKIATMAINKKLKEVREDLFQKARDGTLWPKNRGASLIFREAEEGVITDFNQFATETVRGLKFRYRAGNFFQNNPFVLPLMVQHVLDASVRPSVDGRPMSHFIDFYCGSGLFCLSASPHFRQCVGIEVNYSAASEARANAKLNGIVNCGFIAADAGAIFKSKKPLEGDTSITVVDHFPRDSTVAVIDPPRKGCSGNFLEQLYEYAPQRIVYMSCNPATQARDAKGIVNNGYEITTVTPFDLFPQTKHIESLIVFERK